MTTPCQESVSLGAYLLGALDPEERRAMERHVATCEQCRDELVEMAPLPGLLRHTPFEELPETAAAAESLGPVRPEQERPEHGPGPGGDGPSGTGPDGSGTAAPGAAQPSAEPVPEPGPGQHRRPRRRRVVAAAGLALAACVAGVAVYAAVGRDDPPAATTATAAATWSATDPATHVSASAAVTPEAWGTQFQLRLGGLPVGITCHLVVHAKDGHSETAGTWGSGYASSAMVPASTSISPSEITGLTVLDGSGSTLVQIPPG